MDRGRGRKRPALGSLGRQDQSLTGNLPGDALLRRVWPDGVDAVTPLGGGLTNHNFKVHVGGEKFVLRVGGADTALLGIDRGAEHRASLEAHRLGLGPEVVSFLEEDACLVTRFVEGEVGRVSVVEAAALLRRLHSGGAIDGRFDVFRVVEEYAATARAHDVPVPSAYERARPLAHRIEAMRSDAQVVPCHNDLLAANFIHDGERAWIVDWEYAGMGDAAFDVANFAAGNRLEAADEAELIAAYGCDPEAHAAMRLMSDLREAMWGVVQLALSDLDFDFGAYADEHFERVERAASSPQLSALR